MKGHLRASGFTVVELLVVAAILSVILGLGGAAFSSARKSANMAQEMAAGRTLITAYLAYAAENNNQLMPAFDQRPNNVWYAPDQVELAASGAMGQTVYRYPFRLAPYFGFKMDEVIMGKLNAQKIQKIRASSGEEIARYEMSATPLFGINESFVGGKVVQLPPRLQPGEFGEYGYDIASAGEALGRNLGVGRLLVFATAGTGVGESAMGGYFKIESPTTAPKRWKNAKWTAGGDPANFGRVDARFDGKALCVFLDGSIEMMTVEQLQDMRLWSKNAIEQGNSDYTP